jgi:hypothetical protein
LLEAIKQETQSHRMSFTINIDTNRKIVFYKHSGVISKPDLDKAWDQLLCMKEFSKLNYNLFTDYSNGKFKFQLETVKEIANIVKTLNPILKGKKQAMILKDPISTAGAVLFTKITSRETDFKIKIFSTEKAALNWLTN